MRSHFPQKNSVATRRGADAVCCSVLECAAICVWVCWSASHCVGVSWSVMEWVGMCLSVLECSGLCCSVTDFANHYSVVRCVAVCCSGGASADVDAQHSNRIVIMRMLVPEPFFLAGWYERGFDESWKAFWSRLFRGGREKAANLGLLLKTCDVRKKFLFLKFLLWTSRVTWPIHVWHVPQPDIMSHNPKSWPTPSAGRGGRGCTARKGASWYKVCTF